MNCTINDLQLSFDSNGKLRSTIGRVTGFSVNKAYILASFLRDPNFQKYLLGKITQEDIIKNETVDFSNFTVNDYVKIKQNKLGAILNLYYIEKYHSVDNSKTNKGMGRLNGFTSATAKEIAKNYVSSLLRSEYMNEVTKNKESRRSAAEIIDGINKQLLVTFYKEYVAPFVQHIISDSYYSKEAKEYAIRYLQLESELNEINKLNRQDAIRKNEIKNELARLKDNPDKIKELKEELKTIQQKQNNRLAQGKKLSVDRYIIAQNLVNLHSSTYDNALKIRLRNFSNLVAQSRGDMNGWYFQVFHSKNMTDAYKFFNNIEDVEQSVTSLEVNEDEIVDRDDDQGINQYAKSWEDSFYKSFEESVNGALRMELANLPMLSQPYNYSSNVQAIDNDNELGVSTYTNPQFVIAQIHAVANFSNINSFIRSLEELANTRKSLYGLGYLIDKMKKNKAYANFMFVNFAKPVFNKTIMTINELSSDVGISFDYSNPSAFPLTELVFRLSSKLKATYDISYNEKDKQELKSLQKKLIENKFDKTKDIDSLYNLLTNYFPNFDKTSFNQFIENIKTEDFVTEINSFISNIYDIIKGIEELKVKVNTEFLAHQEQQRQTFEDYVAAVKLAQKEGKPVPKKVERVKFNFKGYDLTPNTYKAIISLANNFLKHTDAKVRLNTSNAEGNTASDIGKNCYISRFFEQILAEDETSSNKGLENLLSYITQGEQNGEINQYANNPLFFGVKDENGVEIVPGMFRKTPNGIVINDNAKQILKYNLFDGVKNNENNAGAIYASMSKLDFFLTQYLAFNNSTEEIVNGAKTKTIGNTPSAVYSMRIGSDAPKIFFIRAPKYNDRQVKFALYNHVLNELNMFVNALNNVFVNENGSIKTVKSVDKLFRRAYYDERTAAKIRKNKGTDYTSALVNEKGELIGNMFSFNRLFEIQSYDADAAIKSLFSLYGGIDKNSLIIQDSDGRLRINPARIGKNSTNTIITYENNRFKLNLDDSHKAALKDIVRNWCKFYLEEAQLEINNYRLLLKEYNITADVESLNNFLLNYVNMNINYDDLFEGDFKYYINARDFLKRTKETQAGGDGYAGYDLLEDPRRPMHEIEDEVIQIKSSKNGVIADYIVPVYKNGQIINDKLRARTGFRGVTIYNTITPSKHADKIEEEITKLLIKDGFAEEKAKARAKFIANGYRRPTKINDAQSYITIEEFIRRRYADGTLSNYQDILAQLLDDNVSAEEIDLEGINARIQVQKNFYYDKVFDEDTGEYYPRQIKNAEFVLIPKLLPKNSELRRIYDWMKANDIGQLNTAETSKAAKKSIFTIWDEQTGEFNENFEQEFDSSYIEEYSYQYLYKQQEVPEHMRDTKNKAGTQFIKKIIDNIDRIDGANEELNKVAKNFLDAYSANITEDFYTFIEELGWEYDNTSGKFYNKEYATTDNDGNKFPKEVIEANRARLNLDKFYERFREEAIRLGMDSNFMDYLIPTESGQPIMPNFMNNTSSKLESIAQAMWNSAITRQTFPGWHAAQITDVGYDERLKFDPETGVMEVYLPRWSNLIPKGKNAEEDAEILKMIQDEGLDIQIGYRIPTEGKQSVSVLRVVGFVNDALGSTIVVPAEWVTQTGSDFDVDSVYGISWEMYQRKSKDGNISLHKIPFEEDKVTNEELYISWVKEKANIRKSKLQLGEEIKTSLTELKFDMNSIAFKEVDKLRNEVYEILPASCKRIIMDTNSANKVIKDGKKVVDIKNAYPTIIKKLSKKLENLNEEQAAIVQEYIDYTNAILDILNAQEGHKVHDVNEYKSKKANIIQRIVKEAKAKQFAEIEKQAVEAGLMPFDEFKELKHVNKLTRKARNNFIIDAAIKIMSDSSSREEQYSRSHFEDITNANKLIDDLSGDSSKKISPYNPLSQLNYFDDAMSGARMKAQSVNWDTTFSKFNRVKAVLNKNNEIEVILDNDSYDIEAIKQSYPVEEIVETEQINEKEVKEIDENIGIENAKLTISTLESDNNELTDEEKSVVRSQLGNKPKVLVASEATDPVFHASKIKQMVEAELTKPIGQRRFHMIYLITKHDGVPLRELAELKIPKFVHFSITSLGGTKYEPGVMKMDDLLDRIEAFIKEGVLNPNLVTIRIDPLIPGVTKAEDVRHIIDRATKMGIRQFKFSVMDSYGSSENTKQDRYVIQKMKAVGYDWDTYYDVDKNGKYAFHPKQEYVEEFYKLMDDIAEEYRISMWTCGEQPSFPLKRVRTNMGCINVDAMNKAMGTTDVAHIKGTQRKECSCYGNKVDALTYNDNCASSCIYCYAKHNGDGTLQYYNEDGSLKDNNFTRTVRTAKTEISDTETSTKKTTSIKLNRLGWSDNNRNITGNICTPYISETTAHHLDAIKEGSIKNVNELTFGVYKLLVGLGLDYEHTIAFIRQPIITQLVSNYNLTKSVYFKDTNDPVKMTIADIAIRLKVRKNKKSFITQEDSLDTILDGLKSNFRFSAAFNELFGIDVSKMSNEEILNIKLPLRKRWLFQRIKSGSQPSNYRDPKFYNKAAIDFSIMLMFNQYKKLANTIEDNIKVLAIDKIGNKPEVRETRLVLNLLEKLRSENIINVNKINLIDSIFPLDENGGIDDIKSTYQYIATVLKHVTKASHDISSNIFITENEDFATAVEKFEAAISKKLSTKEYKEFKKYYVTYVYNKIEKLLSPLTVNERGEISIDTDAVNKTKEDETHWNNERTRIMGYGIVKGPDVNIKDINHPTEAELTEYKKLTPVQKVLFIQKNFSDEQGIFKFIKPTLLSGKDIAIKGVSRQYMSYDDQIDNIEDLYQLFINAFSNHNPLIKLAAIDLIKYAFIAEGFNFKSGYITKIIVNSALYESNEDGGLNIINGGTNTITEEIKTIPDALNSGELQDLYVRSHSDVIRLHSFKPRSKQEYDEYGAPTRPKRPNWTDVLVSHISSDGMIIFSEDEATFNDAVAGIIKKLRLNNATYVKLSIPNSNNKYSTNLYKVVKREISSEGNKTITTDEYHKHIDKYAHWVIINETEDHVTIRPSIDYYLYPLDKLDSNEVYEYSYNTNYFNSFSRDYYLTQIEYLSDKRKEGATRVNRITKPAPSTGDKVEVFKSQEQITMADDTNLLMRLFNIGDSKLKMSSRKFISDIEDYIEDVYKSGDYSSRVINNSYKVLANYFPADVDVIQTITLADGTNINVAIKRIDLSAKNRRAKFTDQYNGKVQLKPTDPRHKFDNVISTMKRNGTPPNFAELYEITIAPTSSDELFADTELITTTSDFDTFARREKIDQVSSHLINDISYVYRRDETAAGKRFLEELRKLNLDRNSLVSLQINRDVIYKNAARYYRSAANSILSKLQNYQVNEDTSFAIDDPRLYDYLVEHDELFPDVAKTILDAISFGSRIKEILNLNLAAEDEELAKNINSIIKSIKDVTQNPRLKGAMDNIFNIYFKKYSNNPEIINDIINLRETYGDTDQLYRWIADATEIANSEVQVILKQVYSLFSKAEMFDVKRNVDEWKKALADIEAIDGDMDINKIIDSNKGIIRQLFNEKFLADKQKVEDDFREAESELIIAFRNAYAKGDPIFKDIKPAVKKYIITKYNRDKFLYENTEQTIIPEYYKQDLENRANAINNIGDMYFEFMALRMQLYNTNFMPTETEEEANARKERVQRRISSLQSIVDSTGSLKDYETQSKIARLDKYLTTRNKIHEKYFEVREYDGFMEEYKKYNDYIINYNKTHEKETLEEKLENPRYKEAYDWIRTNGKLQFSKEAIEKLSNAYEVLLSRKRLISKKRVDALKNIPGAIDENGVIDGTKLTDDQLELLKQEEETDLAKMYEDGLGEAVLIRQIPNDIPLAKRKPDAESKSILEELKYEDGALRMETIARINEILGKVIDKDSGKIQPALLFNNDIVTDDERNELVKLYNTLRRLKKNKSKYSKKKNKVYEDEINRDDYLTMWAYAQTNLKGTRQYQQFIDIFTEIDTDGNIIPNTLLYGYRIPTEKYIDKERTEAIKFLNDNLEYVPTEYYLKAKKEAAAKGPEEFDKWFKLNHVYDYYTHKYKPLKVWLESKPKIDSYLEKELSYTPTYDNMESTVKEEYINPNYRKFSYNYKAGNPNYDSKLNLTSKEEKLRDLIIHTMRKYANTNTTKRFVEEGYLPRERSVDVNGRWALEQGMSLLGLSWHSGRDSDIFRTNIDYSNDFEVDVPMLQLIKTKGTQKYLPYPTRAGKTEEEYQKELKEVKEKNAKIKADNLAIDNLNINKNWLEVMEDFIKSATIHNARANAKPYLYLLLEDLKNNNAYMLKGMWNRKVVEDRGPASIGNTGYRTIQQKHTQEIVHNMARRLLYDQHHENSVPRSVANFLQNMTSAKYMVFNLYGGIANVLIGKSGILSEELAGEYFGFNEFVKAESEYLAHSVSIISSLYSDKANDLTTALMKKFNIVNVDDMIQFAASSKDLDTRIENIRSAMYSFQSIGEHYMQNSVLLAMMKSNRLYTDRFGVKRIGDLKDFTWEIEQEAMEAVLAEYDYLLDNYNLFRRNLKYETQTKYDINSGRKNINRMFLHSLRDSRNETYRGFYKEIVDKYIAKRKELLETRRTEFKANPTVESLFEFKDGYAVIKNEILNKFNETGANQVGDIEKLLADFKEKVKSVNRYIHGWYDKNAAGMIESKWFGSVLMQYHKHLPIGILKRYRRRGFHSEFRGTKERGFYQTLIDFMGTEFTNYNDRVSNKVNEGTNIALASIQVIFESIINSVVNFNTNKNLLAPWENANLARLGGGLGGALAACLVTLALYGLWDDDDLKDDRFKASLLYLADRLYADNTMYTPVGLVTEYRTAWSSPIASANGPSDLIKAMTIIPQYLFDPEFSRTYQSGLYKGKDKLQVLLRRNIPGIRPYDRIMNINKNNQYYKIGESQLGISIAKSFGETLNED